MVYPSFLTSCWVGGGIRYDKEMAVILLALRTGLPYIFRLMIAVGPVFLGKIPGNTLRTFWEPSGNLLGTFRELSGSVLGTFWIISGKLLRVFWNFMGTSWVLSFGMFG